LAVQYSAAMAARIVRCSCIDAVSQFIFDEEMSCSSKFVKRDNTKAFGSDGKHIFVLFMHVTLLCYQSCFMPTPQFIHTNTGLPKYRRLPQITADSHRLAQIKLLEHVRPPSCQLFGAPGQVILFAIAYITYSIGALDMSQSTVHELGVCWNHENSLVGTMHLEKFLILIGGNLLDLFGISVVY